MMPDKPKTAARAAGAAATPAADATVAPLPETQGRMQFDTSNLKSSYCNMCNATSTREEVVLNFGLNESWDLGQRDVTVQLLHRVILSPHAARRLHELMGRLMKEYDARYGTTA
jgi:hypothetical protein